MKETVNYVAADGKIKKATVIERLGESGPGQAATMRLDHSEKGDGSHTAIAHHNADKSTPNTWHQADQNGAPAKEKAKV